jgi:hypothetical protein
MNLVVHVRVGELYIPVRGLHEDAFVKTDNR